MVDSRSAAASRSAVDLIRLLAERMAFLDRQNEELRGEVITLQRKQRGGAASAETEALRQRVEALEGAARYATTERRLLIYRTGTNRDQPAIKCCPAKRAGL